MSPCFVKIPYVSEIMHSRQMSDEEKWLHSSPTAFTEYLYIQSTNCTYPCEYRADKLHWILQDSLGFLQTMCIIKYYITVDFRQAVWPDCAYHSLKAWKSLCLTGPTLVTTEWDRSPVCLILFVRGPIYCTGYYSKVSSIQCISAMKFRI